MNSTLVREFRYFSSTGLEFLLPREAPPSSSSYTSNCITRSFVRASFSARKVEEDRNLSIRVYLPSSGWKYVLSNKGWPLCVISPGRPETGLFSVGFCLSGTLPPGGGVVVVTRMTSMIRFSRPKGNFAGIIRGGGKEGRRVKLRNDFLLSRFERVG